MSVTSPFPRLKIYHLTIITHFQTPRVPQTSPKTSQNKNEPRRLVSRRFIFARFLVSNNDPSPLFLHQWIYAFLAPRSLKYKNYFFYGWFCIVNWWLIGTRPSPKACTPGSILVPCDKSSFFPHIFSTDITYISVLYTVSLLFNWLSFNKSCRALTFPVF